MTKKRLTILHTESSTGWGGQEMRIILEAGEMKKRGHRIVIAVQPGSGIIPAIDRSGFEKEIIKMTKKNIIYSIIKLIRIISLYRVDIINTHSSWDSWIASIAARISPRKPVIIRTRHLSTPVSRGALSRIIYQYLPHVVITTGEAIREVLIKTNRFPENKIISIPTGVDNSIFYPRPASEKLRSELGINKGDRVIGTIAVLRSWKGHDYLLEAAKILLKKYKNIKFVIAGNGPRYNHLVEKAASLGIRDKVFFLGHRDDIPDVLSILDVVVLPSYSNEGVPQSVLQAMAMQKPVVASSAGSIPELVHDGETGVLAAVRNSEALAEGITKMLEDCDFVKHVTANAQKLVETKYSLKNMVDRMEGMYDYLMLERKA